jgi:hypothetical protein
VASIVSADGPIGRGDDHDRTDSSGQAAPDCFHHLSVTRGNDALPLVTRIASCGKFCRRSKLPQSERSWDLFAAERYRRGETDIPSYEAYNPFRHRQQGPCR